VPLYLELVKAKALLAEEAASVDSFLRRNGLSDRRRKMRRSAHASAALHLSHRLAIEHDVPAK
jgi:hypothetical protein